MKYGIRTPSPKKSLKNMTTGHVTRVAKRAVDPLYGRSGMGLAKNPRKSVENAAYHRATVGVTPVPKAKHLSASEAAGTPLMAAGATTNPASNPFEQRDDAAQAGDCEVAQGPISTTTSTTRDIDQLKAVPREDVVCIGTETTGLDPEKDEILQLSIVSGGGAVLFDSLIRPVHRKRWPKAREKNGITWQMVKDQPELEDMAEQVGTAFEGARVLVGYNLEFDVDMLRAAGIDVPSYRTFDVMSEYARTHGRYNDYYGDYTFAKLATAAHHYGIRFTAHNAAEDAGATVKCFYKLLDDEDYLAIYRKADERREALEKKNQALMVQKRLMKQREEARRRRHHLWGIATSATLCVLFFLNALSWAIRGNVPQGIVVALCAAACGLICFKLSRERDV
jgi:DNA polymerase III epsilon subunit-like protein